MNKNFEWLWCILLLVIDIFTVTIKNVSAAPIAGASQKIAETQQEASLEPPIAQWQKDILEVINNEIPSNNTDKRERSNKCDESSNQTIFTSSSFGTHLTRSGGVFEGPSGKETYYNLPMGQVVKYMEDLGYHYKYWIREDGVKMYGEYVMCAADLRIRPKGSLVKTSLGMGIVCDTGTFVEANTCQLDIAVNW